MKKNNRLGDLTFAAIMLAVFLIIHFIFPANNRGIQSIMGAVTPIPIVIYAYCSNIRGYIGVTVSGTLLSLMLYEPVLAVSFIIPNLIFGIIAGFLLKKRCKFILVFITIISILLNLYEIFINYIVTGINFIEINIDAINASIRMLQEEYKHFNGKIYYDINVFAIPIVMTIGGFLKGYLSLLISKLLLNRIIDKNLQITYCCSFPIKAMSKVLLILYSITLIIWLDIIGKYINYNSFYSLLLDITAAYICVYSGIYVITKKNENIKTTITDRIKLIFLLLICLLICPVLAIKELSFNERKSNSA
jgi:hypothetical protein